MIKYQLDNGRYKLDLPILTFGTANFERQDNDEKYFSILDAFAQKGGNCIDTARVYCDWLEGGEGSSESVIGRWMKARGNRGNIIITTKGGHPSLEDGSSRINAGDLRSDIDASLKALQTDYIDIYLLHRDDTSVPVSEIMDTLNEFVESGKAHIIGVSNWTTARIEAANKYAEENNLVKLSVSQINYSLAHCSAEMLGDSTLVCMDTREYTWYKKNNFPVMAFSPQAKGFFSKLAAGNSTSNLLEGQYATPANLARLARVKNLGEERGYSPAVISLAFLSSQDFPVSSVFAVTKLWQLEEDMLAQDITFDKKTLAYLDIII